MEPGELIFLIEHLMAHDGIGIELDDDVLSAVQLCAADKPAPVEFTTPDFAGRLLVALGREAGMAGLLMQLLRMGALGQWVRTSIRGIARASGGMLTPSNVHFNARRLEKMGLIRIDGQQYLVDGSALSALLEPTGAPH